MQNLLEILPFYKNLSESERRLMLSSARLLTPKKGEQILTAGECLGLVLVESGQLRAYICSDTGKEITLYRLLERDACVLTVSCAIRSLDLDINIMADKDSRVWLVPAGTFDALSKANPHVSAFAAEMVAMRLSDIMWVVEQIAFRSLDTRLAGYLLEQVSLEGNEQLSTTHDTIARDLGTAREVISRLLKYFANEGIVELSRNTVKIVDIKRLRDLSA